MVSHGFDQMLLCPEETVCVLRAAGEALQDLDKISGITSFNTMTKNSVFWPLFERRQRKREGTLQRWRKRDSMREK